jgi:hypothetical protein
VKKINPSAFSFFNCPQLFSNQYVINVNIFFRGELYFSVEILVGLLHRRILNVEDGFVFKYSLSDSSPKELSFISMHDSNHFLGFVILDSETTFFKKGFGDFSTTDSTLEQYCSYNICLNGEELVSSQKDSGGKQITLENFTDNAVEKQVLFTVFSHVIDSSYPTLDDSFIFYGHTWKKGLFVSVLKKAHPHSAFKDKNGESLKVPAIDTYKRFLENIFKSFEKTAVNCKTVGT